MATVPKTIRKSTVREIGQLIEELQQKFGVEGFASKQAQDMRPNDSESVTHRKLLIGDRFGLLGRSGQLYKVLPNWRLTLIDIDDEFNAAKKQGRITIGVPGKFDPKPKPRPIPPPPAAEGIDMAAIMEQAMKDAEPPQPLAQVKLFKTHVEISHADFARLIGEAA